MANATQAMTPEEALQAVASVRGYRERLTARAAGIVWMVWGLALAFHGFAALFVEFPALGADVVDGNGLMPGAKWMLLLAIAFTVYAGGMLTNAVWHAHALETDRTTPAWVAFAASGAVIAVLAGIVVGSNVLADSLGQLGQRGIAFSPLALLAAGGAATIAILQRRRVAMLPGLLGALVLLNLFVFGRFLAFPQDSGTQAWGAAVMALSPILVYFTVASWTVRKA